MTLVFRQVKLKPVEPKGLGDTHSMTSKLVTHTEVDPGKGSHESIGWPMHSQF